MIGKDASIDRLSVVSCLSFGFECDDLFDDAAIGWMALPLGLWWQWLAGIRQAAEVFEAQFCGFQALSGDVIALLVG